MHIPPKRRRRILSVHYLTQRGHSQRKVAQQLNVSHATVRSDLQLIETHWSSIAAAAADDILLESLQLLQLRLSMAVDDDQVSRLSDRLTPVEYLRARDAQEAHLNALAREVRRTAGEVHRRASQRPDQPGLYDEEPQKPSETTQNSSITNQSDSTISSPIQEIVESEATEEKSSLETIELPGPPDHDALISEAVQHFPHLKGQSEEQILTFLDQLTDPDGRNPNIPPPIYAEAAG